MGHCQNKNDSANFKIDENELNNLGYQLLAEDHVDEALAVFKLNIDEYLSSANAYDSYGDAFLAKGDSLKALENYKIAFERDTSFNFTRDKIKALESELK